MLIRTCGIVGAKKALVIADVLGGAGVTNPLGKT
jgi:hypothetical protein